ncbi:MAG: 30S ribosomal protein S21 [Chloroflexi bacterium]|nr:30S ribosomal protein S21 [Chloroflexota bacterium]
MSHVVVREGETFDSLLRRFNKRVQMDGILSEARRRSHFEKPSMKRKRKAAAKRRKSARTTSTIGTTNTRR